jgi:chemotaxis protein MotB
VKKPTIRTILPAVDSAQKSPQTSRTSHHGGGAWKVAAADFFTAMMALFMVMWILSQDDEMLAQTAYFFNNPYIAMGDAHRKSVSPIDLGGSSAVSSNDSDGRSGGEKRDFVEQMAQQFMKHLNIDAADEESPFAINTSSDGIAITVFNRSQKPVFEPNSDELTSWGTLVLRNIAWLIDRYELGVRIEAHTRPGFKGSDDYGPWELSADQANAVRRTLVFYALAADKLSRVTAFADTRPDPEIPLDSEAQQRIIISLEPQN